LRLGYYAGGGHDVARLSGPDLRHQVRRIGAQVHRLPVAHEETSGGLRYAVRLWEVPFQSCATRRIVLPGMRLSGANAAAASASGNTALTTGLRRPSRTRAARSASRARSGSTTKNTARPSRGRVSGGSAMVTSVPPARTSAAER